MSDGQVGGVGSTITTQQPALQETEQATKPARFSRQSITKFFHAENFFNKSKSRSRPEKKPLTDYKITRQEEDSVKAQVRIDNQSVKSQTLTKNRQTIDSYQDWAPKLRASAAGKKNNDWAVEKLETALKEISNLERGAKKEAQTGLQKITASRGAQAPVSALTPAEVEAQKQLEEVQPLKAKYQELLVEAKGLQKQFRKERTIAKQLDVAMNKLESKRAQIRGRIDTPRASNSRVGYAAKVDNLQRAKKEVASLAKEVKTFEKQVGQTIHGAVSEELSERLEVVKRAVESLRGETKESLREAKTEQKEAARAESKARKKQNKEIKEMIREGKKVMKNYTALRPSQSSVSTAPQARTKTKAHLSQVASATTKKNPRAQQGVDSSTKPPSDTRTTRRTSPSSPKPTRRAPPSSPRPAHLKSTGTLFTGALFTGGAHAGNSLAGGLMDSDLIPLMTGIRGGKKTFKQLEDQIFTFQTLDDLKQIIADRHASKLAPSEQKAYYGLMLRAMADAPKRAAVADEISEEFIKIVLKGEPEAKKQALDNLGKAKDAKLEKRLKELKKR